MSEERKTKMISARVPDSLVGRVDYVTRNTDSAVITNRSAAVQNALEKWLPEQESDIERKLGGPLKKAR